MSNAIKGLYEFDKFRLNVSERILSRGPERVPLSEKAFETLCVLVKQPDHLISKDELLNEVWVDTIVEENNLAKNISLLRKALGLQANGEEFIETVRGHGFRFRAVVRKLQESYPLNGGAAEISAKPRSDAALSNGVPAADKRENRFWLIAIGSVTLATLVFLGFYSTRQPGVPVGSPITSVAVLPFVNAADDPEARYLSDGVSESVIDRLSELPQIKVIARSSSFVYRGENVDLRDAADKLGVQAIITGRIVRRGDDLAVRVELIDVRDNKQLWGGEFNRKATDALLLQREISQTVSEKLSLKLSGEQEKQLAKVYTANPHAYELLLKARFYRATGETDDLNRATEYLRQAVAVDPQYALAHAELSMAYSLLGADSVLDPKLAGPKAEDAAKTALQVDGNLAEGHLAHAIIKMNAWDWAGADREYNRALDLNPNLAQAYSWYSTYLSVTSQHERAIEAKKRAAELDPLSLKARVGVAWTLSLANQHDQAIEGLKGTLELDRNFVWTHRALAFAYLGKGHYKEALAEFEKEARLSGNDPNSSLFVGVAHAKAGHRERARAILRTAEASNEYVSPGELYVLYTALGEYEKAFLSLEKAYAAHDLQLMYLKIDPLADPLRDDPRFADILRRINLE